LKWPSKYTILYKFTVFFFIARKYDNTRENTEKSEQFSPIKRDLGRREALETGEQIAQANRAHKSARRGPLL
jgi:hypothetical protein